MAAYLAPRGLQQGCSTSAAGVGGRARQLASPIVGCSLTRQQRRAGADAALRFSLCSSKRARQHVARAKPGEDEKPGANFDQMMDETFNAASCTEWLKKNIEDRVESSYEIEESLRTIQQQVLNTSGVERTLWGWVEQICVGFIESDKQFNAQARKILDKLRELPPTTNMEGVVECLLEDPEIRSSILDATEGYIVIGDSFGKLFGATALAFIASTLFGAEPYQLWQMPAEGGAGVLAIAQWTAPFAALSLGLVALGWLNERNPQRLVADPEESALGWGVVRSSGWGGVAWYSLCTSAAAGIVYRGLWLNSALGAALSQNAAVPFDPALGQADLRDSFGTLVPTIPIPAVVVTAGVVAGTALWETAARTLSRNASGMEVQVISSDDLDLPPSSKADGLDGSWSESRVISMPSVFNLRGNLGQEQLPVAGRFATANEWYADLPAKAIAVEFLMTAYLGAETLATGSLWASIATQAVSTALCVYACKAGVGPELPPPRGDDDEEDEKQQRAKAERAANRAEAIREWGKQSER